MINVFYEWAKRENISYEALGRLLVALGAVTLPDAVDNSQNGKSEAWVQSKARLVAAEGNTLTLFRNNVGALQDKGKRLVRFGLMNESEKMNEEYKSGDHIGIRRVLITPEMIGQVIGQFVSVEYKEAGWEFTGNGREAAQMRWAQVVNARGGLAVFVNNPDNIRNLF